MSILDDVAQAMQSTLIDLATHAATDSGFSRRASKLGGAAFVQAITFGCLQHAEPTLEDFAQAAAACGTPATPQAIDQRFGPAAADCLQRVLAGALGQVIASQPAAVTLLQRFRGVYLHDSTVVPLPEVFAQAWPGCGGRNATQNQAALKCQVRLDLCTGRLEGPVLQPGRTADLAGLDGFEDVPAGSLWLADLGYFSLKGFATLGQRGAFWLSLWQPGTVLLQPDGQRLDVPAVLSQAQGPVVDRTVLAGAERRLVCRLVALRVSAEEARRRQRAARAHARKKGQRLTSQRLALCHWTIHLTNLSGEQATAAEIETLRRSRWQIELLFKQWKSDGGLERSRSAKPDRVLCEVLGKLLAAVVQHWALLSSCWEEPSRSLRKAARSVRGQAMSLAAALPEWTELCRVLELIKRCVATAARVGRRRDRPPTHARLQDPTISGYALN